MRTRISLLLPLVALAAVACRNDNPTDSSNSDPVGKDKTILTSAEAQAVFAFLRTVSQGVETKVPMDFTAPYTVSGTAGSAAVRGTKKRTTTSSTSSSTSTETSDLSITFLGYGTSSSSTVSGSATYYEYHYSRTACSSSTCASAYDDTESLKGSAISVKFPYGGVTYSDRITIDAYSGPDTSFWDVTVTNQAGARFTFSVR